MTDKITEAVQMLRAETAAGRVERYLGGESWVLVARQEDFPTRLGIYRAKPAPKLRPWTGEEGVGKVVRWKDTKNVYLIVAFWGGHFRLAVHGYHDDIASYTPEGLLKNCEELDGSPCGVEVGDE